MHASTREQNLDMQVIALENTGCKKIHEEIVSGVKADRPVLNNLLKQFSASGGPAILSTS